MNVQETLFIDEAVEDLQYFLKTEKRKRVLVFPPVNNYRRFLIHQLVQDRFGDLLQSFSIGQGFARRTVVCYKSDFTKKTQINGNLSQASINFSEKSSFTMGIESQYTPSASPEHTVHKTRNVRPVPTIEIYRPPAARRARLEKSPAGLLPIVHTVSDACSKTNRQKRPDRAVYVPRHRRSVSELDSGNVTLQDNQLKSVKEILGFGLKSLINENMNEQTTSKEPKQTSKIAINTMLQNVTNQVFDKKLSTMIDSTVDKMQGNMKSGLALETIFPSSKQSPENKKNEKTIEESFSCQKDCFIPGVNNDNQMMLEDNDNRRSASENRINFSNTDTFSEPELFYNSENMTLELNVISNPLGLKNKPCNNNIMDKQTLISEVLIISSTTDETEIKSTKPFIPIVPITIPEKKVKKIERPKSKPAPPPLPPTKINRDECDWDSLFDDNGDCLDPTLIEELTTSVGEVLIEKPKCSYKTYARSIEVSSDEFAHVLEIYNFPSEFKSSDLAAVFSPFKNGGFELKWVDDTHCLGVFSSPLVAAEVLASDHPFVKTRPLSEATALSKTKARRSSEFLQPYRSRPETCAALARRLVTKSLGVTLATARQEREQEKILLREAKEKRRLANKQREDVWEGIIAEKLS